MSLLQPQNKKRAENRRGKKKLFIPGDLNIKFPPK
jgi:hypothetical protein